VEEGGDRLVAHTVRLSRSITYSWIMRGYTQDKDAYLKRLRRIEGQVRGLQRMVESDTYCIDVLTQVSAVTRALQAVALGLVEDHLGHCVTQAIEAGGAGSSTRSIPAASPTRPATASATCAASSATSTTCTASAWTWSGCPRCTARRWTTTAT